MVKVATRTTRRSVSVCTLAALAYARTRAWSDTLKRTRVAIDLCSNSLRRATTLLRALHNLGADNVV